MKEEPGTQRRISRNRSPRTASFSWELVQRNMEFFAVWFRLFRDPHDSTLSTIAISLFLEAAVEPTPCGSVAVPGPRSLLVVRDLEVPETSSDSSGYTGVIHCFFGIVEIKMDTTIL